MKLFDLELGTGPLVISIPHDGREVPPSLWTRFTEAARVLPDTDWHVARLYDFARELDATILVARYSRYVIDLNRPSDDRPLYQRWSPGLVPTETFAGEQIYAGDAPDDDEVQRRREDYWQPYHAELESQLERIKAHHGFALLWDAHSIRGEVPTLFEGRLPDLNLGTADGASCGEPIARAVFTEAQSAASLSSVRDARFRGGYITRTYGRPDRGVHALQLELSQTTYMDEKTRAFDKPRADRLRAVLRGLLKTYIQAARAYSEGTD